MRKHGLHSVRVRDRRTKRALGALLGLLTLGGVATQALAMTSAGAAAVTTGYVEVCKASAPAPNAVTGNFTFTVTDSASAKHTITVGVGLCSAPVQVAAGTATIVETAAPWYKATSISGLPGSSNVSNVNLATGSATLSVVASADESQTTTVSYTNSLVTGVIEVCKVQPNGGTLTGSYSFTVTGADGFSATATAPTVGSCSLPVTVPAGSVTVQEQGAALYVTGITATSNGTNELNSDASSISGGTAVVGVNAGDSSVQTIVTYTDDPSSLKLCKVWDPSGGAQPTAGQLYPFTLAGISGPAGPNTPPASESIPAGTAAAPDCVLVGQFRAGTVISLTEGIVPGTKVESINVNPAGNVVPTTLSLTGRTVQVLIGAGETVVTFTDVAADPGTLKVCATAGTTPGPPTVTSFTYTINTSQSLTVPVGGCQVAGTYPFNSNVTIVQTSPAPNAVSGYTIAPTFVTEIVGGVPTLTTEPVLVSDSTSTGTAVVTIGENDTTEVSYTDVDPPSVSVSNGASSAAASSPAASSPAGSSSSVTGAVSSPNVTVTAVTAKLSVAKLAKLKKEVASDNAQIRKLSKEHFKSAAAKKAALKKIAALRAAVRKLNSEIKQK